MTALCLVLSLAGGVVAGERFKVGDEEGWREPDPAHADMYALWAGRTTFRAGDSLCKLLSSSSSCVLSLSLSTALRWASVFFLVVFSLYPTGFCLSSSSSCVLSFSLYWSEGLWVAQTSSTVARTRCCWWTRGVTTTATPPTPPPPSTTGRPSSPSPPPPSSTSSAAPPATAPTASASSSTSSRRRRPLRSRPPCRRRCRRHPPSHRW